MEPKIMICDLDGTLLTSDKRVTEKTIKAIRRVRDKGILFGICSGRDVENILCNLPKWHLEELVDVIVGSGGAEVYSQPKRFIKRYGVLSKEAAKAIIGHFDNGHVNFGVPYGTTLKVKYDDDIIKYVTNINLYHYKKTDYEELLKEDIPKICVFCFEEDLDKLLEKSKSFPSEEYHCIGVQSGIYLMEYLCEGISKSEGLRNLADLHNLTLDDILAFGDADNDYDMIKHAGIGVVMDNGTPLTKSVADYITDDNDHEGIVSFIEKYIL